MEKTLEQLKLEAERELADRYLERFGVVPAVKEKDSSLIDFNN